MYKFSNIFNKKNKLVDTYFNSIEKIQKTDEYNKNRLLIYTLRNILIENCEAPEKLVDSLIETVAENTAMEYENANKKLNKHIS